MRRTGLVGKVEVGVRVSAVSEWLPPELRSRAGAAASGITAAGAAFPTDLRIAVPVAGAAVVVGIVIAAVVLRDAVVVMAVMVPDVVPLGRVRGHGVRLCERGSRESEKRCERERAGEELAKVEGHWSVLS